MEYFCQAPLAATTPLSMRRKPRILSALQKVGGAMGRASMGKGDSGQRKAQTMRRFDGVVARVSVFAVVLLGLASIGYAEAQWDMHFGGSTGFKLIQPANGFIALEGGDFAPTGCPGGASGNIGIVFLDYPDVPTKGTFMAQLLFALGTGKKIRVVGDCVPHNGPPGANVGFFTVRRYGGSIPTSLPYRTARKNKGIRETSQEMVGMRSAHFPGSLPSTSSFFIVLTF
jgi:hypothetical protein